MSECNAAGWFGRSYGRRANIAECNAAGHMGPRHGRRSIVSECNAQGWLGPVSGKGQNSRHGAIAAASTIPQPHRLGASRPVVHLDRLPDAWPCLLWGGLAKRRA